MVNMVARIILDTKNYILQDFIDLNITFVLLYVAIKKELLSFHLNVTSTQSIVLEAQKFPWYYTLFGLFTL